MSIHNFPAPIKRPGSGQVDTPGGGGDDSAMETRVSRLESIAEKTSDRLTRIEGKLDGIEVRFGGFESHYATKSDLSEVKADLIKWIVGTAIGLGVAGITVMTFVLNNAIPKAPQPAQAAPIIINIPAQSPTPPPSSAASRP